MSGEGRAAGRQPSELALRVVSALVLIAAVLTATWYGGRLFAVICAAVSVLVLIEYLQIARQAVSTGTTGLAFAALGIVLLSWFGASGEHALAALVLGLLFLALFEGVSRRRAWSAGGLAYAALPFFALVLIRGDEPVGLHAVFLVFACVWGADTLAYFAGRAIGGPKLAPKISPKKTWAGFFGGIAGSVIAASAVLALSGYALSALALALMVVLSIVSQMGDLLESWIKRRFGKKDSGKIIPGHGGMLDRIDGLITAGVAAWLIGGFVSGQPLVPGAAARGLFAAFILP